MSTVNGDCNVGCIVSKKNSDMSIVMCIVIECYTQHPMLAWKDFLGYANKFPIAKIISSKI